MRTRWTALSALALVFALPRAPPALAEGVRKPLPPADAIAKLPPDGGPEFNRLVFESSPYLRQHARNPVDWFPWGTFALRHAKMTDRPIFLSVGYSTCHWCHVMEHESFEDPQIAAILNEHFVAIKVDREERPDLDDIYMTATYLLHGSGGWPNSLWLTPEGKPFYAGTYFPKEDGRGRRGFRQLLLDLAERWKTKRGDVEETAEQIARRMQQNAVRGTGETGTGDLERSLVRRAIDEFAQRFDSRNGGSSGRPKFPPHQLLELMLYEHRATGHERALQMTIKTLDEMAKGGIYDHIGGGFHRYSTDERWFAPHFEKMLYDNAQLGRVYVDAHAVTGDLRHRWVAEGIFDWVLREMTDERGGFRSALDADSEGIEGKYYVWTREQILDLLGSAAGERFAALYNITSGGNWAPEELHGQPTNIAHLSAPLDAAAKDLGVPPVALHKEVLGHHETLRAERAKRIPPGLDDKVLTAWNGLMMGSMARAGQVLEEARYVKAAKRAADFVLETLRTSEGLQRSYRAGTVKLDGYLEDYAYLADGLIDVHLATGDERYLREAASLAQQMWDRFWDTRQGGFWFTAHGHEKLLTRTKDPFDNAIPSANGVAARVYVRLGQITGDEGFFERGRKTIDTFASAIDRSPRGTATLVTSLAMLLDGKGGALEAPPQPAHTWGKPDATARKRPVRAEAFAERDTMAKGSSVRIAVRLTVDDGWHVNSSTPLDQDLIATGVTTGKPARIEPRYPKGKLVRLGFSETPVSVYDGESWLLASLDVGGPGGGSPATINLRYQACNDERCLKPETLALPLTIQPGEHDGPRRHVALFDTLQWGRSTGGVLGSVGIVGLGFAAFGLLTLGFVVRRRPAV